MTDSWDAHRAEIEQLYIQDNKTLKYIAEFMARKGFRKTKSQYETQFKKWGLRKKQTVPRNANWDFIAKRVEKRKRLHGKESEVVIDEETIPPEKVRRLQYGRTFLSTVDRFAGYGAPSPKTPEGVVVRTPPSIARLADQAWSGSLSLAWSPSLPWLRFTKLLRFSQDQDRPALSSVISIPPSSEASVQPDGEKAELMQRLEHAFPLESRSQLLHMDADSRTGAILTVFMPEEYEGQHQLTQRNRLSTELYILSNNLESHDGLSSFKAHNKRLLAMIRTFGWHKGCQFKTLLASQEPTVEAIVEKTFASAVREVDIEVMKLILEAGMDPNSLIEGGFELFTPLQLAATVTDSRGAEMAELLISYETDIELIHDKDLALFRAIENKNDGVIEVLLRHNVVVDMECLADAARTVDANLFEKLLASCADILGYNELRENGKSPLLIAIHNNKKEVIEVLLRYNVVVDMECLAAATYTVDADLFEKLLTSCPDVNSLIYNTRIWEHGEQRGNVTLLGEAAKSGRLEIIKTILRVCPSLVNPRELEARGGAYYFSPISVAITNFHPKVLKALLDAGVDTNFVNRRQLPPIERALASYNLRAYEILVENGATLTQPLSYKRLRTLMSFISGEEDCVNTMKQLINESARLSENFTEWSGEVLAEAINENDPTAFLLLLDCGATVTAEKVTNIGNAETAQYLDTCGVLQPILDRNGPSILLKAAESDPVLTQWLLVRAPVLLDESLYSWRTPLCSAANNKQPELVRLLLSYGASVTDRALFFATNRIIEGRKKAESPSYEASEVLHLLLSHFSGAAPIAVAVAATEHIEHMGRDHSTGQNTDILQLLLSEGVEPTGTPTVFDEYWHGLHEPQSALEVAVASKNRLALEILTQLPYHWGTQALGRALVVACSVSGEDFVDPILQRNPKMNEYVGFRRRDVTFSTALQVAVRKEKVSVARKLLGFADTDINCGGKGPRGRTALQHAVENGNLELITMLLNHDADVNRAPAEKRGATALQIAAIKGYLGIARRLVDLGADVNAAGAAVKGRTALEGAAEHGRIDMVHMLLEEGAWIFGDAGERQYKNAVALGRKRGHYAVARMIERFKTKAEQAHGHTSSISVEGGGKVYEEEDSMI